MTDSVKCIFGAGALPSIHDLAGAGIGAGGDGWRGQPSTVTSRAHRNIEKLFSPVPIVAKDAMAANSASRLPSG